MVSHIKGITNRYSTLNAFCMTKENVSKMVLPGFLCGTSPGEVGEVRRNADLFSYAVAKLC